MENASRSARPKNYANGLATRETVLHRAAEIFALNGYHGASLRAIARSAGIDHSTLLHHFGDKTGLLLAVLEWRDEEGYRIMRDGGNDPHSQVAALLRHNESVPGLIQLYAVLSAEATSEGHPARPYFQARSERLVALVESAVRKTYPHHVPDDIRERVLVFFALWEGLQVYDAINPGRIDLAETVDDALRSVIGS